MVSYKYGAFGAKQFENSISYIRKKIYFLLLMVDEETSWQFQESTVEQAYEDLFNILNGLNKILYEPKEMVITISLLETALSEYEKSDFDFETYRKLVLDAGNEIEKIKGR